MRCTFFAMFRWTAPMVFRDITTGTRLLVAESMDAARSHLARLSQRRRAERSLDLAELDRRVLLSAAPAAIAVEALNPSETDLADVAFDVAAGEMDQSVVGQHVNANDVVAADGNTDSPAASFEAADEANNATAVRHELVFVDTAVSDYQQLLDDLWANDDAGRDIEVVLLSGNRDGIEQISEALSRFDDLDAVHFVSHGSAGSVKLGSTWLSADNLDGYAGQITLWQDALTSDADLLFYGCDLAAAEDGQTLIDSLAALTGADVAASVDDTGHALLGGDWDLEYAEGNIETAVAASPDVQEHWSGLLAVTTFQEGASGYAGTEDTELRESAPSTAGGGNTSVRVYL